MIPRSQLIAAAAALAGSAALAAPAGACTPPRLGPSVAAASEPWRGAVEALRREAAAEGQPWGCTGGALDLVEHEGGARLTVTGDDGRTFSREVSSPDDIVPLGEAMLAKPAPLPPPAPPAAPPRDVVAPAALAEAVPPPRVLVSALVAPRYAGGANAVLGGVTAAAAIPFGPWLGGVWVRYDALSAPLGPPGSFTEVCLGASAGRSFAVGPVELRTSALGSAAIVTRSDEKSRDAPPHIDARFGLDARGVIPITRMIRAVVALDAEVDPQELAAGGGHADMGKGPSQPSARYPEYTIGLGVGMELALR